MEKVGKKSRISGFLDSKLRLFYATDKTKHVIRNVCFCPFLNRFRIENLLLSPQSDLKPIFAVDVRKFLNTGLSGDLQVH